MKVEQDKTGINFRTFFALNCTDCRHDKNKKGEDKDEFACDKLYDILQKDSSKDILCKQKIKFFRRNY